jgi:hypothetical protein
MDGQEWIPPIKSRQPGSVKSADASQVTSSKVSSTDHSTEVGKAKYIGFNLGTQLQKKDTGLHIQP